MFAANHVESAYLSSDLTSKLAETHDLDAFFTFSSEGRRQT